MKNDVLNDIKNYLPQRIYEILKKSENEYTQSLCEIRMTIDKPIIADCLGKTQFLKNTFDGKVMTASAKDISVTVEAVTQGSMYSVNETIKNGFVTVKGGHRIGFCGSCVYSGNEIKHIKDISSVCIRISRSIKMCAYNIKDEFCEKKRVCNVLIASPPGCGKTTFLRDICRMLADGVLCCGLQKVGIADERSEIAAVYKSVPQHEIGAGAFVCDGYAKSQAMQMMLRAMSPNVIITDEIGTQADFKAVKSAIKSGVSVVATAHAYTLEDLCFKYGSDNIHICFEKIIFLKDKGKTDKIYRRADGDY